MLAEVNPPCGVESRTEQRTQQSESSVSGYRSMGPHLHRIDDGRHAETDGTPARACAGRRIADGDAEAACCTTCPRKIRFEAGACSLVNVRAVLPPMPLTSQLFIDYGHARGGGGEGSSLEYEEAA